MYTTFHLSQTNCKRRWKRSKKEISTRHTRMRSYQWLPNPPADLFRVLSSLHVRFVAFKMSFCYLSYLLILPLSSHDTYVSNWSTTKKQPTPSNFKFTRSASLHTVDKQLPSPLSPNTCVHHLSISCPLLHTPFLLIVFLPRRYCPPLLLSLPRTPRRGRKGRRKR